MTQWAKLIAAIPDLDSVRPRQIKAKVRTTSTLPALLQITSKAIAPLYKGGAIKVIAPIGIGTVGKGTTLVVPKLGMGDRTFRR